MPKSMIELVVGDLEEKRAYRQLMKRVNLLPEDYRFAFKKVQHYMYNFGSAGCDMTMFTDLVELFEASAATGKSVLEVTGCDVAGFCDELIRASAIHTVGSREKLNQEVLNYFSGEDANHAEHH